MAWTEQDYQEIVARLMAESIGVNEVPDAGSTDDISSLPAYQPANGTEVPTVVKASLELLVAPALEAADKANEAADKAENNATAAQTAANTANEKAELAAQAASDVNAAKEGAETAAQSANTAASNANEKAVLADAAAANANDTAEHPTYIGQDHYVYRWNKTAQAYDKTDIYTKGDAFSIKKVYASVANMEADKSNPDITEGDFVLVNTGDVEDPDNAKLYVKADGDFEFLVDMSGAIGFTGKTPQFSIGTISTLEAGSTATATISEDGVDSDGNPKYKINFAIPRGNPGAPFRIAGEYATLEALKSAVPDGSAVDGFMAVGTEAPYDYYAWVNGDWVNQGKIAGGGSGNVVVIPSAAMSLSDQATSDEIFNAFGGKDAFMDICQSIVNKDTVCVVANIPEEPGMKLVYIPIMAMATYTDANNANFMMAIITETTFQLVVTVTDGVATQSSQVLNHIYEAPSDGNVYGRKNKDWVEVPEHLNLTSEDLNDINGAGFATQKSIAGYTTPENNYPINENGALIFANAHYSRSNQIYGSYLTNRWFARGGGNQQGIRTDWKEFVFTGDVLTKTNTSWFTPTEPYHPATKDYVDTVHYGVTVECDGSYISENNDFTGASAVDLVKSIFTNYQQIVTHIITLHKPLFIHINGNYSCIACNSIYAYKDDNAKIYELSFTYTLLYSTRVECKIFGFHIEENTEANSRCIIKDLIKSDNLTTLTKKSTEEYAAITNKDEGTMYAITDA